MRLALLKDFCGKDVAIESLPFVIGRCKTANFIILHVNVSRNHCQIIRDDSSWKIEDFSSSGTYVNNILVGKGKIVILCENDIIRLGSVGNNLEGTFISFQNSNFINENKKSDNTPTFCEQSQKLMELHFKKCKLEERIYRNNLLYEKKTNKEKKLNEKYKFVKHTKTFVGNEIEAVSFSGTNKEQVEEKENSCSNLQNEMHMCNSEITEIESENKKLISYLTDVQKKLEVELVLLNSCFQIEKNKLEAEIKQKQIIIEDESKSNNKDSSSGLAEQNILIEKLNALEEAQKMLFLNLKKANTLKLRDITSKENFENIEDNISNLKKIEKETEISNIKQSSSIDINDSDLSKIGDSSNLLKELKEVKNALSILEEKNSDLEGKLKAAIKKENGTLQNITDLLETELQCTICSELFVTTVTLNCTHSFCEFCLNRWKKKQKTCPICRKKIMSENRSLVIDSYIDKMVQNLSVELKDRRKALIAERNEPIIKKKAKRRKR